jgi:phosphoribosylamine-glycine ligase
MFCPSNSIVDCSINPFSFAQVLMMRLESDLAQVLLSACKGELGKVSLTWSPEIAMV